MSTQREAMQGAMGQQATIQRALGTPPSAPDEGSPLERRIKGLAFMMASQQEIAQQLAIRLSPLLQPGGVNRDSVPVEERKPLALPVSPYCSAMDVIAESVGCTNRLLVDILNYLDV